MIDIHLVRENPELVKEGIQKKGYSISLIDEVVELDKKHSEVLQKLEELRDERNKVAK
jgi:seryl-tRNA synthetase